MVSEGRRVRRAKVAVALVFFLNGALLASWFPHLPAVKARHHLGDGRLGIVLVSMAVGSVAALLAAGWIVGRFGSRVTTSVAAFGLCVLLPLPALVPSV